MVFVFGLALIPFVDKQFFTQPDQSEFVVRFEFPTGTSIAKSEQGLRAIEQVVFAQDEVAGGFSAIGFSGGVNSGLLFVNMFTRDKREAGQLEVMSRLRKLLGEALPEATIAVEVASIVGGGFRNADMQFIIQGPNTEELDRVSQAMMERMRQIPGFVDVDNDLRLSKPEVKVSIKREYADDLGVDVMSITQNFSILYGGMDIAKFTDGARRYDIRLKADPESRAETQDLYQVALRSSTGEMIETSNLIDVIKGSGPDSINRYNRSRSVTLFANLENLPLGEALGYMDQIAEDEVPKEPGWATIRAGSSETFTESFRYFMYAIVIALFLIYAILGSQFESFVHPFTILMSVPLSVVGGIGLLLLTGRALDIFSFIGFVMLIGIVTKNAILLVDIINQQRAAGLELQDALRKAGPLRLRPILMTAFTTMAAVTPIALALSEGGEQRAPMAVAVIGGLATSTFLTLLVVPCVYLVMDRFSRQVGQRASHWLEGPTPSPEPEAPAEENIGSS
jgi:HAE1 family hydrophobic/amphiphilic exporter-1